MPEEPTTPDLVELVRKQVEALDRGDLDGVMSRVAEDAVLDGRVESLEGSGDTWLPSGLVQGLR